MKTAYSVKVTGKSGTLKYEVEKTLKGAKGFAQRIANEAFYGEEVSISITPLDAL